MNDCDVRVLLREKSWADEPGGYWETALHAVLAVCYLFKVVDSQLSHAKDPQLYMYFVAGVSHLYVCIFIYTV